MASTSRHQQNRPTTPPVEDTMATQTPAFDDDDIDDSNVGNGYDFEEPAGLDSAESLEDILGFEINKQEAEEAKSKLQLPKGDYTKLEGYQWTHKLSFNDKDKQPGDKSPKGRLLINIFGRVINNTGREGFFGFMMSPDLRYFVDRETQKVDENKFDNLHLAWWQAYEYYTKVMEEEPATASDVIQFLLESDDIVFRITEGKSGGNFLGGFKLAGKGR